MEATTTILTHLDTNGKIWSEIAVIGDPFGCERATRIAEQFGFKLVSTVEQLSQEVRWLLVVSEAMIELHEGNKTNRCPIRVDFTSGPLGYRLRHLSLKGELLARAVGVKNRTSGLQVVDGTAGFGIDAYILASLGCQVTMLERSSLMVALLEDGLRRLSQVAALSGVGENLQLLQVDCASYLGGLKDKGGEPVDVVYLDPIYPTKQKSAANRRSMQVLRALVGDDSDADHLLVMARSVAKRVVVKRPRLATPLADTKPDFQVGHGQAVRYDIYLGKTS